MPSPRARNAPVRITRTSAAPRTRLDEPALRRALASFLKMLGHGGRPISLLLGSDEEIGELNRVHRGKNRPTDVLSWSYLDAEGESPRPVQAGEPLGDLAVSLDRARAQAKENGWPLRTELLRLLAHGCAHLAGYDHETAAEERAMRTIEEALLTKVGLTGLYPAAETKRASTRPPAHRRR